jgi:hypothetical protein
MDFPEIWHGGYPKLIFLISYDGNTNTTDFQSCEMGG